MCNVILATPQGREKNELITILGSARLGECCLRHEKIIRLLHGSGLLGMTIDFLYAAAVRSLCAVLMQAEGAFQVTNSKMGLNLKKVPNDLNTNNNNNHHHHHRRRRRHGHYHHHLNFLLNTMPFVFSLFLSLDSNFTAFRLKLFLTRLSSIL
jgi:hypothetical protein